MDAVFDGSAAGCATGETSRTLVLEAKEAA